MCVLPPLVEEEGAADHRSRILADREPHLGFGPKLEVVRRTTPAHLGGDPTWVESIGHHRRPAPRQRKSQHNVEQLRVGVRLGPVPPPALPLEVGQIGITAAMHAGAQIDQALGLFHERS